MGKLRLFTLSFTEELETDISTLILPSFHSKSL